jgi:N-acetylglutamate synthase-like GNAT family acetyltransferase
MKAFPTNITKANAFVMAHHRHCRPTQGGLFAVAVGVRGEVVGVAIVGRPIARKLDDGETCEITRLCVLDGVSHLHACSNLYGRCVRIAREMGYSRVLTYTLEHESGTSLKAAGFTAVAAVDAAVSWSVPSRPRVQTIKTLFGDIEKRPSGPKVRWERSLTSNRRDEHATERPDL